MSRSAVLAAASVWNSMNASFAPPSSLLAWKNIAPQHVSNHQFVLPLPFFNDFFFLNYLFICGVEGAHVRRVMKLIFPQKEKKSVTVFSLALGEMLVT